MSKNDVSIQVVQERRGYTGARYRVEKEAITSEDADLRLSNSYVALVAKSITHLAVDTIGQHG